MFVKEKPDRKKKKKKGVFIDIPKAFDKVWHQRLIFKLKSIGVSDFLLSLVESFLYNRFQRDLLNGPTSEWLPVKAGVPQIPSFDHFFFPNLHQQSNPL